MDNQLIEGQIIKKNKWIDIGPKFKNNKIIRFKLNKEQQKTITVVGEGMGNQQITKAQTNIVSIKYIKIIIHHTIPKR